MGRPYTWDIDPSGAALNDVVKFDGFKFVPGAASYTDPLTTKGDLVGRSSSATGRVPVGTNGYALLADSTATFGVAWTDLNGLFVPKSLVDAKGDLIAGTADNAVARVAVGADGTILTADSTQTAGLRWGSALTDPTTTKGDVLARTASALARVGVGTDGQVLTADAASTPGVKWATPTGGSSSPYVTEPGLKPPGSAHALDDEFDQANGTNPTASGWTWANQQNAVATVKHGKLVLTHPATGTKGIHFLSKVAPGSGDVSLTTRSSSTARLNFHGIGVVFLWGTLATPTRIELIKQSNNTTGRTDWDTYTGYNVAGTARGTLATPYMIPMYLRLSFTTGGSGTLVGEISPDGVAWMGLASSVGSLGRPDFCGVFIDSETAAFDLQGTLDFFRVNWTPDYDPTL